MAPAIDVVRLSGAMREAVRLQASPVGMSALGCEAARRGVIGEAGRDGAKGGAAEALEGVQNEPLNMFKGRS